MQLLASFRTLKAAAAEADGVPGSGRLEPTFLFEVRLYARAGLCDVCAG